MLQVRVLGIELIDPGAEGRDDLSRGQVSEATLGLVPHVAPRGGQVPAQPGCTQGREHRGLGQRSTGRGHPPDATVRLVAIGMTQGGLVVPDDGVEPVGDIDRPIRADPDIHRAKSLVTRPDQGRHILQAMSCAIDLPRESIDDTPKIPCDQHVAVNRLGQVRRLGPLEDHGLDPGLPDLHLAAPVRGGIPDLHQAGQQLRDPRAIALDEGLSPGAEGHAPGVAPATGPAVGMQLERLRTQSPRTVLIESADSPGCFHAGEGVQALAKQQFAARAPGEGVDILVGIPGPEPGQHDAMRIGLVIAVGVFHVDEVVALADVGPAVTEGKPGGHIQSIGKDDRLVRTTIPARVLENQ